MAQNSASGAQYRERDGHLNQRRFDGQSKQTQERPKDFTSHGVTDNDIFMLPASDFQLLGVLTGIAALVRLFRIYQPSSVVFDEVQ